MISKKYCLKCSLFFLALPLATFAQETPEPQAPVPIPFKKSLPPATQSYGRLFRDELRGNYPSPMPLFNETQAAPNQERGKFSWVPDCESKNTKGPKQILCRDEEAPLSNQDPDAEILEMTASFRIQLAKETLSGVRLEVNGNKTERPEIGTLPNGLSNEGLRTADVAVYGYFTPIRVDLIPDPKEITSLAQKKWEEEVIAVKEANASTDGEKKPIPLRPLAEPPFATPVTFYYTLIYPEWAEAEESHVGQLSHPKVGVFTPHLGFASTTFTQENTPPLSQVSASFGLDYLRRGLLHEKTIAKLNFNYVGIPFGGSVAANKSDVKIKTLDLSVLAGMAMTRPGSRLTANALVGIWLGNSTVTFDIAGYKNLLWPKLQGEVGYYLTSRQKIQGEASIAVSNQGFSKLDFKYMRYSIGGAYLYRLPSKLQLNASAGFSSIHFGSFLGTFTGTQLQAQFGVDYRL